MLRPFDIVTIESVRMNLVSVGTTVSSVFEGFFFVEKITFLRGDFVF